jgi:disulfide bond formation protein DsbB
MLNVKYMHVISFFYTKKNLVEFGFDGTWEKADSINGFLINNIFGQWDTNWIVPWLSCSNPIFYFLGLI